MRESPVRYFTPEDCPTTGAHANRASGSAEVVAGHGGASALPTLTSAAVTSCTRRRRLAHRAERHSRSERAAWL